MEMNIIKVWVDDEFVSIQDDKGQVWQERIADYPRLRYATKAQREDFEYDNLGIHWEKLDEDLSFEGFVRSRPEQTNQLAQVFKRFPMINVSMLARHMGIPQSVFASYLCGLKKPSEKRKKEIEKALQELGNELSSVTLV